MKLAFCLFRYFPYGGLQRDFIRIARLCYEQGHEIDVYTMQWEGEHEPGWHIHCLPTKGMQNHTRCLSFVKQLQQTLRASDYDRVIGFNKMPGLDWYYAADVCYVSRMKQAHHFWYRLLPRYRTFANLEKAVFASHRHTHILLLNPIQKNLFQSLYHTEPLRLHMLPPGISKHCKPPPDVQAIRQALRLQYHLPPDHFLLLMIGSGFKTKGLDRILKSLAALPKPLQERSHLFILGSGSPKPYQTLAKKLNVEKNIRFLGGITTIAPFLWAGDLLLHPARYDNTGTVLLEAMVAGLPVLTTASCGYASYIEKAQAGMVLPDPFHQSQWNECLKNMLLSAKKFKIYQENGIKFAQSEDLYSLTERAVTLITQMPINANIAL